MLIERVTPRDRFDALVGRASVPLAEAVLALAEEEYPGLDAGACLAVLDSLAGRVAERAGPGKGAPALITALRAVLYEEEGFRGNEQEYYDPRNSFLNEVLSRKLGIPISLSILFMEVASRAGLRIEGVSFPGHFLVKHPSDNGDLFIDPYNGGELLSAADCEARFRAVTHGRSSFDPRVLQAVNGRQIIARMLYNLKRIYVEAQDDVRALWVIDRLLVLAPESPEERRDRGLVSARLGGTAAAIKDLAAYLDASPGAEDVDEIEGLIRALKTHVSYLN